MVKHPCPLDEEITVKGAHLEEKQVLPVLPVNLLICLDVITRQVFMLAYCSFFA